MATGLDAVDVLTVYRMEDAAIAEVIGYGRRIQTATISPTAEQRTSLGPDALGVIPPHSRKSFPLTCVRHTR